MFTRFSLRPLIAGLAISLIGCSMGPMLIHEYRSPYDFDTTVATVVENAKALGWDAPKVFNFQESLLTHGKPDPGHLTVIKLCSPEHASKMFASDNSKFVSVMAPCSISVYEKSDGKTYLAAMNMKLMAKVMGGEVGQVLAEIAADDEEIICFAQR